MQISKNYNSVDLGAYSAHDYLIKDSNNNIIQQADIIHSIKELNTFSINPFDAVLNGYIAHIESTDNGGVLKVQLDEPYTVTKHREDLVILEFWFKELKPHDKIPLYGGINNAPVPYEMLDHRVSIPTTNRVQLQWRIRAIAGDKNDIIPHYDNGKTTIEYLRIHPQGPIPYELIDYYYRTDDNDPHLFIAGEGLPSALITNTIDGYIYAIPLFEVSRLNTSGYNAYNNTNGGSPWINEQSTSGREELDGKFANVIYTNDINDQRYQAYLGTNELDKKYTEIKDFNIEKQNIQQKIELNIQNINEIIDENNDLKREIQFLQLLTL